MEKKKAVGVMIFGLSEVFVGILAILYGIADYIKYCKNPPVPNKMASIGPCFDVIFLLVFLFLIIIGIFTLTNKKVGRILNIIFSWLVAFIFAGIPAPILRKDSLIIYMRFELFVWIFLTIGIIYYFTRPKVKEQFK